MKLASILIFAQGAADAPGILDFFLRAGAMAKFVLATLVFFSIFSWAIMIGKSLQLRRAEAHSAKFREVFHQGKRFSEVNAACGRLHASPLVGIFRAGYAEIDAQIKAVAGESEATQAPRYRIRSLSSLERSLRRAVQVELRVFLRNLPFLAITAASTPFIGLFGTVWGIMMAFREIGITGSTSIGTVAPGIAEALVNTAAGLAAAIPALIGYNLLTQRTRRLRGEMDDFVLEFLNMSERNFT